MARKKRLFRFRIPWLSGAAAARPATESLPPRPKDRSKSPPQPDTFVPIQRPPPPAATQTRAAPGAEPQQQSSSRPPQPSTSSVTIESSETSDSEPPSGSTTPTRVYSPLPSPSRSPSPSRTTQNQASSPSTSPSRTTKIQASSPSTSPSHAGSPSPVSSPSSSPKTRPQSPAHLDSGRTLEVPKPAAEESALPAPSATATEQEKEKMVMSEPVPQESEPKVKSPLRTIPKSPETTFQPERTSVSTQATGSESRPSGSESRASSVPSSPISKTESPASQPQSSSHLASEGTSEVLKPSVEESTLPAPSASQEQKGNMAASEPVLQESEPKMKSPLKIIPKSPETSSLTEKMSTQPTEISGDERRSTTPNTQKVNLDSATGNSKAHLGTESKLHQSEEKEKVVDEAIKVGKPKDTATGQPIRQATAELHTASASGTQTKVPFTRALKKRQEVVREAVERKMMFATSSSKGKDIRVVGSADTETRNVPSISPEKPVLSNPGNAPLQKGIKDDISNFVHKLAAVHPTQPLDDTERPVSIITLAGDNRGATMQVGSESAKKEGAIHIDRAYKTDPEENTEVTTDVEENTEQDSHNSTKNDEVGKAYVNSNIQSINNSLMFHGSISERDRGVQMILPQKPEEPIKPDDQR